jgi:hypothetical protein
MAMVLHSTLWIHSVLCYQSWLLLYPSMGMLSLGMIYILLVDFSLAGSSWFLGLKNPSLFHSSTSIICNVFWSLVPLLTSYIRGHLL